MLIPHTKIQKGSEEGFTLIELSIVLVIIGLIVGGILTGQDLIKAAEQRATLAQIEKYNTAVNTFRNKFGGIPGDLASASASSFGLYGMGGAASVGGAGWGDGNGLIEGGGSGVSTMQGEVSAFFRQLSDATLVDGSFGAYGAAAGTLCCAAATYASTTGLLGATTTSATIGNLLPQAKLGRGNYIAPFSLQGVNYFVLTGMNSASFSVSTAGAITAGGTDNLTANESYNMDKKVDDGLPNTGSVIAWSGASNSGASFSNVAGPIATTVTTGVGNCATATASGAYEVVTGSGAPACSMRFRFN